MKWSIKTFHPPLLLLANTQYDSLVVSVGICDFDAAQLDQLQMFCSGFTRFRVEAVSAIN